MEFDGRTIYVRDRDKFLTALNKNFFWGKTDQYKIRPGRMQADLFIEGPCSDLVESAGTAQSPLGDRMLSENLRQAIAAAKPDRVVMFPTCCEMYSNLSQERIQKAYPDIDWVFPVLMTDLGCSLFRWPATTTTEHLLQALCMAGVVDVGG